MILMGEESGCHLSLANRKYLHEGFCMESSRIFLFSSFKSIDAFCSKRKGSYAFFIKKRKVLMKPNVTGQQALMLCHKRESASIF